MSTPIENNTTELQAILTSVNDLPNTAVLYSEQTLTDEQKTQARTNIGAASTDDIPTTTSELTNDSGFITSSAVPTKTSELTNDSGFLTSHQDISGKLDIAGGTMTGALVAQNNTSYTTGQVRNIFLIADGASLPSGANGDICLVYTP